MIDAMQDVRTFVAKDLHTRLREEGRTQTWLARRTGISRVQINRIALGRCGTTRPRAERIAAALGTDIFALFDVRVAQPDRQ